MDFQGRIPAPSTTRVLNYELSMDYLQLLYLRNTGKSTFLNFLKALFQNNVTFKDHQKIWWTAKTCLEGNTHHLPM